MLCLSGAWELVCQGTTESPGQLPVNELWTLKQVFVELGLNNAYAEISVVLLLYSPPALGTLSYRLKDFSRCIGPVTDGWTCPSAIDAAWVSPAPGDCSCVALMSLIVTLGALLTCSPLAGLGLHALLWPR